MIVKGRNRDTAWYAMIDRDWPGIKAAFEAWLDPANFDAAGRQKKQLERRGRGGRAAVLIAGLATSPGRPQEISVGPV